MTKRFNGAGYVIEEVDELGQVSKIERTIGTNLATKTTGPCGCLEAERTFDTRGNVTSVKDRLGKIESWQYRPFSPASNYDPLLDQVTQYTDKRGNVTGYGYDAVSPNSLTPRGNLTTMTDARLKVTTYTYDYARGAVMTRVTDPLNNKRDYDYDANAFMNSDVVKRNSDQAVISQTTYEYDAVGNLKKVTDGEGRITTMNYDDLNRMINSTDPANTTTTFGYDENGNNTSVTDILSRQWVSSYDKKNRLEAETDPLGRVSRWQYDTEDQLFKVISPSGRVMRYTYDERGQRKTVTDGLGNVVTFNYDNRGNLKTLSDQRGNVTTFDYDELFRLTGQRDPLGRLTKLEYDEVGNIKVGVDRLGRRVDLLYDVLNRPQQATFADATVTLGYDDAYRWTSVSDAAGTITWGY